MKTRYQIVILGLANPHLNKIKNTLNKRLSDLGISLDSIIHIDENTFKDTYIGNAPTVGLYFGGTVTAFPHLDILRKVISGSNVVLPIVEDLENFSKLVPKLLIPINGFELKDENKIESLVSRILEVLGLLRLSRRLFISYRRNESTGVAIQLFEKLEKAGFDVFLDTHSIKEGDIFQDELWHRLVDTDVVVLLNTEGFLKSEWTEKELARASAMSIGILQIIWPNHTPERSSELSIPIKLSDADFENNKYDFKNCQLNEVVIPGIISSAESLRARSLGARQDNLVTEFMNSAKNQSVAAHLQPEKFINVIHNDGTEAIIIPTIGVPHAFTYNQSEELIKSIKSHKPKEIFLLYNHMYIREKWLQHLSWLDEYLPVNTIKLSERDNWLKKFQK